MIKKILSIFMAFSCIFSAGTPVFADSDDEFFEVVEDTTDWKTKYEDLKNKYRERFFEVSDKRYDDDEDKESENIEDYDDVTIEDVLYEENKEEK